MFVLVFVLVLASLVRDVKKLSNRRFIKDVTRSIFFTWSVATYQRPAAPEARGEGNSGGILPQNIFEKETPGSAFSWILTDGKEILFSNNNPHYSY